MYGYEKSPISNVDGQCFLTNDLDSINSMDDQLQKRNPTDFDLPEYNTSQPSHTAISLAGYDVAHPATNPIYVPYVETSFNDDQVPLPPAYERQLDHMSYGASSFYHPTPQVVEYDPRKAPKILLYNPQRGSQGTHVFVYIESPYDLNEASPLHLSLMFATRQCQSILTQLEPRDSSFQYVLTADAPAFSSTGWNNARVPLRMQVQDESGFDGGMVDVGSFYYTDAANSQTRQSLQESSRKRKASADLSETVEMPAKRLSNQQLDSGQAEAYFSNHYPQSDASAYSQTTYTTPATPFNQPSDDLKYHERSHRQRESPGNSSLKRISRNDHGRGSQFLMKASSPAWGSSRTSVHQSGRISAPAAAVSVSRLSSLSSPSAMSNPPLIRTSTLQQPPSSVNAPMASSVSSASGPFNPYAMYPHKAVLKINGDLDSMADRWTTEERSSKRRLVQFSRSQSGSTISTDFEPVAPDARSPNSICISCIMWEERQECFVTSVDTIYLLESLVAVRFEVDEKNRIRRNLEGFRPMTVSKAKSDSESFFKVIMGFPTPKPRNIEKDVKVFPWKILAHALKKIIGKYSASYSSTASAFAPRSSIYGLGGPADAVREPSVTSPRSPSSSTVSSSYATSIIPATVSPRMSHGRMAAPGPFSEPPPLQAVTPSLGHAYTIPTSFHYRYPSQEHMSSSLRQSPMTTEPGRGSLDFTSFIESSPTIVNPIESHPLPNPRPNANTTSGQASAKHELR